MTKLPIIPGRGLVTKASTKMRLAFLEENELPFHEIANSTLDIAQIQNNIESYIGSVEIPIGLVGPLLFNNEHSSELLYCAAGTLEGALIASMNRGAKAISLSGGFSAKVLWQKMCRAPLFLFDNPKDAARFVDFTKNNFEKIKNVTSRYSNHANLLEIKSIQQENNVHLKFIYSTGDASGQNMTTTCTWHAMLFITDLFKSETGISPVDFVIEGNAASDKKVSMYNIQEGRGIHVVAECILHEEIIEHVLRTSSLKMESYFHPSKELAATEGMVGYNINLANAIAAIFAATGQDLASVHESSVGILAIERVSEGLHLKLTVPNLVIGTVGGGTHLSKQSEALALMGCSGTGKVEKFAKLIAGFALGLEISTYAAIVSGEFAKAHEKLGRNKPVNWLLASELNESLIKKCLNPEFDTFEIEIIESDNESSIENGILTNITARISKKLIGFTTVNIKSGQANKVTSIKLLLKSKPLDEEVIKGLHVIAASIDPHLSDLIKAYKDQTEYSNSHRKEAELCQFLSKEKFKYMPGFFGKLEDPKREIYLFLQEFLDCSDLALFNTENNPEVWSRAHILDVLSAISSFHNNPNTQTVTCIQTYSASKAIPLYSYLLSIIISEDKSSELVPQLIAIKEDMHKWEDEAKSLKIHKTVIHNDFNPRNIAIRKNGDPCIYDWELAVIDYPSRDIVEFLSFVLNPDFSEEQLLSYLNYYADLNPKYTKSEWLAACKYSLKTYIASRVSFYEVSGILIKYDFSSRILRVALKMLEILNDGE